MRDSSGSPGSPKTLPTCSFAFQRGCKSHVEEVGARGRQVRDQGRAGAEGDLDEQPGERVAESGDSRQREDLPNLSDCDERLCSARGAQVDSDDQRCQNEIVR